MAEFRQGAELPPRNTLGERLAPRDEPLGGKTLGRFFVPVKVLHSVL